MAARLTDRKKKKIVADYLELGSYTATAKKNGVSKDSVRRIIRDSDDFARKAREKKEENTADILAYMEKKREAVCGIIEAGLEVLPEKIRSAKSASEVTTALGTLIDKWAPRGQPIGGKDQAEDDPITRALKERYGRTV